MSYRLASRCLAFLLIATASQHAVARDNAPLPEGFEPWPEDGFVNGLFVKAHAVDQDLLPPPAIKEATALCQAKNTPLRFEGDAQRLKESEYWLYRTSVHAALFSRSYDVRIDTDACVAKIHEKRSIERMLVADGWSYHLGRSPGEKSWSAGQSPVEEDEWPGRFAPHIDCGGDSACKAQHVAGVSARCAGVGSGFVGSTSCVSKERDITRGMTVYDTFWTDDGEFHEFKIDEVRRDARINRSVFDLSLEWPAPLPGDSAGQ